MDGTIDHSTSSSMEQNKEGTMATSAQHGEDLPHS